MRQNPHNAVVHVGNTRGRSIFGGKLIVIGTVSLWTPNSKEAAIKMFCHKGSVNAIAIHRNGV
jgi:U3 small nucleolar RNA-associated protein 7